MENEKIGLLCHGRHLEAINWPLHQFGDTAKGNLGQIAKTCYLAHTLRPEVVVFGTGASERDGVKEAEFTIKYMFEHFDELRALPQFNQVDLNELRKYMQSQSVAETTSKNTVDEIARASEIFGSRGIKRAYIVSNPDHIARCFQLAHNYQMKTNSGLEIFAAQSDVCYDGTTNPSTKIIEKPHRGDDPSPDLSSVIGGYFKLPLEKKKEFIEMIKSLLQ